MFQGFAVGRVGKDAELRKTKEGTAVSNFSLAVETGWGERKKTLWVDCTLWGAKAEGLTEYLTKGKTIAVLGELDLRSWLSNQDHEAHGAIQLTVSELTLCGSPSAKAEDSKPAAAPAKAGDSKPGRR